MPGDSVYTIDSVELTKFIDLVIRNQNIFGGKCQC